MLNATWFSPRPPYSSGTVRARKPCSPISSRLRRGNSSSSSERLAFARISFSQSEMSSSRSSFWRSVRTQFGSHSYPRPQNGSPPHVFSSAIGPSSLLDQFVHDSCCRFISQAAAAVHRESRRGSPDDDVVLHSEATVGRLGTLVEREQRPAVGRGLQGDEPVIRRAARDARVRHSRQQAPPLVGTES